MVLKNVACIISRLFINMQAFLQHACFTIHFHQCNLIGVTKKCRPLPNLKISSLVQQSFPSLPIITFLQPSSLSCSDFNNNILRSTASFTVSSLQDGAKDSSVLSSAADVVVVLLLRLLNVFEWKTCRASELFGQYDISSKCSSLSILGRFSGKGCSSS